MFHRGLVVLYFYTLNSADYAITLTGVGGTFQRLSWGGVMLAAPATGRSKLATHQQGKANLQNRSDVSERYRIEIGRPHGYVTLRELSAIIF